MPYIVLALALAPIAQTGEVYSCSNPSTVGRDCRGSDGTTYVERHFGDQTVREGHDARGNTWVEREYKVFDGSRTEGSDSSGRTWVWNCNPRFGIAGTARNGNPIYIPPEPPRSLSPDQQGDTEAAVPNMCQRASSGPQ